MVNIQLYPTLLYEFIQVLMMILCFLSDTFDSNILLHPLFILIMLTCWIIILNYILTPALIQSYKNKKVISKPHQYAFCARFSFVWFDWFGNCQHLFARAQQFFRLHQMFLTIAINQRSEFHTMRDVVYLKNVIKV